MKNLMITAGIVLLMLTMLQYQTAYCRLVLTGERVNWAAEEAAASAALCIDAEGFGEGILRWDRAAAEEKAAERILQNLNTDTHQVRWEVIFEENQVCPKLTVILYYDELRAVSAYEYVPLQ